MAGEQMARELFTQGRAAYDAGNYDEALEFFQQAYARSPRPKLLFNIGQAADRLRKDGLALASFRQYLDELPDESNREHVENRVRALEEVIAEREAREAREAQAREAEARAAAAQAEGRSGGRGANGAGAEDGSSAVPLPPLLLAGGGVALVAGGLIVGMMAKADEDDYAGLEVMNLGDVAEARAKLSTAEDKALAANVLLGVGAAAVIGGAIWFALEWPEEDAQVRAAPLLGPGLAGISLRGSVGAWGGVL